MSKTETTEDDLLGIKTEYERLTGKKWESQFLGDINSTHLSDAFKSLRKAILSSPAEAVIACHTISEMMKISQRNA